MSVAGDIIDELRFDRTEKVRAVTGFMGVFVASIFVVIGVFGMPQYAASAYTPDSSSNLEKASNNFVGGNQ